MQERERLFARKIQEEYGFDAEFSEQSAREVLKELPQELLPNIDEWSRGEKLSEIVYCESYSVPQVMAMWNSRDFLSALRVVIEMDVDPERAIMQIWGMRR